MMEPSKYHCGTCLHMKASVQVMPCTYCSARILLLQQVPMWKPRQTGSLLYPMDESGREVDVLNIEGE